MSSTALFIAEFLLTALVVLGFAAHQLWQLRKLARDRKGREPPPDTDSDR